MARLVHEQQAFGPGRVSRVMRIDLEIHWSLCQDVRIFWGRNNWGSIFWRNEGERSWFDGCDPKKRLDWQMCHADFGHLERTERIWDDPWKLGIKSDLLPTTIQLRTYLWLKICHQPRRLSQIRLRNFLPHVPAEGFGIDTAETPEREAALQDEFLRFQCYSFRMWMYSN